MPLTAGAHLGSYEILGALGAGGMGEVYRARDTKLNRDVAIKVLPEAFTTDPDRLARFKREAHVLAALNHPNIAAIYGFEESDGVRALVLEFVNGPTLADRIAQGRLPIDEALPIARQIAKALEAAHEQGIVHRDLKPANVKLRDDGTVKVLDFGLAKALEPAAMPNPSVTTSPTITSPALTQFGMILGTAAYMAPEQAKGRAADKRSDVWSFGCVLYEMLTGKRPFDGDDVSDTLAAVLRGEPDWQALPAETPTAIRRLLRRCLEKDRKRRLADAADARLETDDALTSPAIDAQTVATVATSVPLWRKAVPAAVAAIIVGLAGAYGAWILKPDLPRAVTRLAITLPDGETPGLTLALSPDGTRVAYTANNHLYVRPLDQLAAVDLAGGTAPPLASTRTPFFSPDGQWIGFSESAQLKKVSVSGGAPVMIAAVNPPPNGVTWTVDNTILIGRDADGIWRVSADGGSAERIIAMEAGQRASGPQLLPDGRNVLFTLARTANWDESQVVVQSLDTGTRKTLITGGTDGRYLTSGHLIYALGNTLLAVPFDARSLSVKGGPVPVVAGVGRPGSMAQFAASSNGTLVYAPAVNVTMPQRTLVWVDRHGREEAIPAQPRFYSHPRLSPDGSRLAVELVDESRNAHVWVWDFARATWTRVTSDPAPDREPAWTPDGKRLIFTSWRTGVINLFTQAANGSGTAERVSELNRQARATPTVSPDGRHVVVRAAGNGNSDLMILDLDAGRGSRPSAVGEPRPLIQTPFEETNAEFSPDGRWLAYQSNRSGAFEVYVSPFPDVGSNLWLVSTAGGTQPLWSRDGRELFYRSPNGAVMRVPVTAGAAWSAGTPTQLFESRSYGLFEGQSYASGADRATAFISRTYDVSPDGQRFLMIKDAEARAQPPTAPRIIVVQNWTEELKRLVPAK